MRDDFSDVISPAAQIELVDVIEFEFDGGVWRLRREGHRWEVQFESEAGEEAIVVEREDFVDGKFDFNIDGAVHTLTLGDFEGVEAFVRERGI